MAKVSACFLGTAFACLLFLFGVDQVFIHSEKPEPQVSARAFNRVVDENHQLRNAWWQVRQQEVKDLATAANALEGERKERERANLAEARLASMEQQLATVKTLLDTARRDQTRIPLLGDEARDRIPPQNIPLP